MAAELPTTVLILQHSERFDFTNTDDPELTPEGKQRAQDLLHVVGNAGIAAVFSPKAKRMMQTVEPLLKTLKLQGPNYYDPTNLNTVVQEIKEHFKGKTVLVVGAGAHMGSGGIQEIVRGLGCAGPECAFQDAYDNLIVVTVYGPGQATAAKLRFGKPVGTH